MKKTYLTPAIEIESIVVEQGIAISGQASAFTFDSDLSTFENADENDAVIW